MTMIDVMLGKWKSAPGRVRVRSGQVRLLG